MLRFCTFLLLTSLISREKLSKYFPLKNSWKCCSFVLFLAVDNFDFTRKIVKKIGWKTRENDFLADSNGMIPNLSRSHITLLWPSNLTAKFENEDNLQLSSGTKMIKKSPTKATERKFLILTILTWKGKLWQNHETLFTFNSPLHFDEYFFKFTRFFTKKNREKIRETLSSRISFILTRFSNFVF